MRVLMLAGPPLISTKRACETLLSVDGVQGVHHVHLWMMEEKLTAIQAYLIIEEGRWSNADVIKDAAKAAVSELGSACHVRI